MTSTAKRDISDAVKTEFNLGLWFAAKRGGLFQPNKPGENSSHDFKLWIPYLCEVKCDFKAEETGNCYFETWNSYRDKPSGLSATKSQWWLHYLKSKCICFVFSPSKMLGYLKSSNHRKLTGCGDNNSDGFLVPYLEVSKLPFVTTEQIDIL